MRLLFFVVVVNRINCISFVLVSVEEIRHLFFYVLTVYYTDGILYGIFKIGIIYKYILTKLVMLHKKHNGNFTLCLLKSY